MYLFHCLIAYNREVVHLVNEFAVHNKMTKQQ